MKVALYARVSTDDRGQDPETQLRKLRERSAARGHEIVGEYVDFASGKNARRDELDRLMLDAKAHRFDYILVTKIDRMMRSTKNLFNILEKLEGYGVGFECSDQDIDTKTPTGKLLLTLLSGIAEFERELCSSRVKDGMARARAEGKHVGHPKGQKNANKRGHKKATPLYSRPALGEGSAIINSDKGNPLSVIEGEQQ